MTLYLDASQVISYPTTMSTWYDISGYNYKASLVNGPTFNSSYGSITFDGSDDYGVFTGTGGDILSSASRSDRTATWEGIVRFSTSTGANAVTTKWDNTTGMNWWFGRYPSNTVHLALMTSAGYQPLYSSTTIGSSTTQFQYIAVTTSGSNYVFYINGVNAGSGTYSGTWDAPDFDTPVTIGAQNTSTGGAALFGGDMSKVRLYNKTLSAAEVAQNYYGGPIVTSGLIFAVDAGNLVSYPKTGTSTYNLTGSSNNGTLINGTGFSSTNGGTWTFDGTDDGINIGTLTPTGGATFEAWIWLETGNTNYGAIFANWGSSADAFWVGTYPSSDYIQIYFNGNLIISTISLPFNTWMLLTVTNDVNNVRSYINGALTNTASGTLVSANGVTSIGYDTNRTNYPFKGNISNAKIYNRALTAAEVQQNYNATK